ncbi:MAG TPA: glycosyltransferase, partial [Solirubrobacteraceae bacterium]
WGTPAPGAVRDLRADLGLGPADPLVLFQGAANANRHCTQLVEAIARLPGVHLLFLGDVAPAFAAVLRDTAAAAGAADRVHLRPAVPIEVLLAHTRQADAGASLLTTEPVNHRLTMPNKVMEYIAAGLPVVATAGTAFGDLVERLGVGFTADSADPVQLAAAVAAALDARRDPALAARLADAGRTLNWGAARHRVVEVYERLAA